MNANLITSCVLYAFFWLIELSTAWRSKSVKGFTQKYTICFWLSTIFVIAVYIISLRARQPGDIDDVIKWFRLIVTLNTFSVFFFYMYLFFRGIQLATALLEIFIKGKVLIFSQLSTLAEKFQQKPVFGYGWIVLLTLCTMIGQIIAAIYMGTLYQFIEP